MTDTTTRPDGYGFSVREIPVPFEDRHANAHQDRIHDQLRLLEAIAAEHYGPEAGHRRKRLSRIDHSNPATARLIAELPTVQHWLTQIPTAAALHPLYDPETTHYPTGVALDHHTREWFRNIADAHGIRSRAAVMRRLLAESAAAAGDHTRWLSLACGAAQPVFQAMEQLARDGAPPPETTLADLDRGALALASTYAAEHGLHARTARVNVLDRHGFASLATRVPGLRRRSGWLNAFDVVDAIGILEYLKPDDWTYTYSGVVTTRRRQSGAITFVRNAFECVRPGGVLITGNMLDTHPQLGFTMDVVQWPHIQPRSTAEMLDIFHAAELRGHVDIYLPSDGVYAVYAIRKG